MNKLTTKEKGYYIIFYDNSNVYISESQYKVVLDTIDKTDGIFEINGNIYKSGSISKVLSEADYDEQYQQKENSQVFRDTFKPFKWEKVDSMRALQQMIKGLKKFIDNEQGTTPLAQELLERMQKKQLLFKND